MTHEGLQHYVSYIMREVEEFGFEQVYIADVGFVYSQIISSLKEMLESGIIDSDQFTTEVLNYTEAMDVIFEVMLAEFQNRYGDDVF